MNVILASNLNMKCLKVKSIFSTLKCIKNCELKCMSNQPTEKSICTANQNILIPLKKSIPYSQALWFNKICYNGSDLHNNYKRLLNMLTKRGNNKTDTTTQINRAISIPRNELLNKIKTSNSERSPFTVTNNRILPDLKIIIDKNWHILQIEPKLKKIFAEPSILAFKRNKNLKDIIWGNKVFDNKKILNVKKFNKGKCQPCFASSVILCCKQLKTCSTFQSTFNKIGILTRH